MFSPHQDANFLMRQKIKASNRKHINLTESSNDFECLRQIFCSNLRFKAKSWLLLVASHCLAISYGRRENAQISGGFRAFCSNTFYLQFSLHFLCLHVILDIIKLSCRKSQIDKRLLCNAGNFVKSHNSPLG